jgi:hypothetical protein
MQKQARTEWEWRCQLTQRSHEWSRLRVLHGDKANLADLGPIPLPPVSLVEYHTRRRREQN